MYRLRPNIEVKEKFKVIEGVDNVLTKVIETDGAKKIAIEVFPGVDKGAIKEAITNKYPQFTVIDTDDLMYSEEEIFSRIQSGLTADPVFGTFSHNEFIDFFDFKKIRIFENKFKDDEHVIAVGVGAAEVISFDLLVFVDITRWEVQLRYKKGEKNWKGYKERTSSEKIKRAYYFDWVLGDNRRREIINLCNYYIDATKKDQLKMVTSTQLKNILECFTKQPFRLVPYFDPGIWGGSWMQEKFNTGRDKKNLAWSFDGVPEENSIIAKIQDVEFEMPAQILVDQFPKELLGEKVFGRYGRDFPIRFDFLDTFDGQNLSLQVHPTLDYSNKKFGAKYTQDESYYIVDCKDNAEVFLGVNEGVEKSELVSALKQSKISKKFDDEKYINRITVKKHDHLLIPAGTIHSSGKNCVVLEISSTPNRFTFKLWDWGRLDLDGRPRPISIEHGENVINTDFDEIFAEKHLINSVTLLHEEPGISEEKTGLHDLEPIETHRLTFSKEMYQNTQNSVNMLNLVEGEHIKIKSPTGDFKPYDVFYGETFIIPESIKEYILEPINNTKIAKVMKAYIR